MSRYTTSPPSSRDDSAQGTPQTNLSMFSPEDGRGFKVSSNRSAERMPLQPQQQTMNHDPFGPSSASKSKTSEQKLSATASTFQPKQPFRVTMSSGTMGSSSTTSGFLPGTVEHLNEVIDKAGGSESPTRSSSVDLETTSGTFTTSTRLSRCIKVSDLYKSDDVMPVVESAWKKLGQSGYKCKGSSRFLNQGDVAYIRLSNIVDSIPLYNAIQKDSEGLSVEYISPAVASQASSRNLQQSYTAHEGQVVLKVKYPATRNSGKGAFELQIRDLLAVEGPIRAWQKIVATEAGIYHLVAEFEDACHAGRAIQRLNGTSVGNPSDPSFICLAEHQPDVQSPILAQHGGPATTPTRRSGAAIGDQSSLSEAFGSMNIGTGQYMSNFSTPASSIVYTPASSVGYMPGTPGFSFPQGPVMMGGMYSPQQFGPMTPSQYGSNGFTYGPPPMNHQAYGSSMSYSPRANAFNSPRHMGDSRYFDEVMVGSPREDHYGRFSGRARFGGRQIGYRGRGNQVGGQHNHVEIDKIQAGLDVRTTVMLRNIPNKVDQAMLKSMMDESSFGQYDFMYLRIDFSNNCNVGYAFINFVDPLHIIEFVRARSNQKWKKFQSEKVAEVSYATIQGRDCLIQKFRNSSVMLEPAHYRPKLFYTHQDQNGLAGQEEEFPASDNSSKLKRSCENAEHVGLFAPSAGQHLRDEQRRRRSQYDRGTSLAERDEFYDEGPYLGYGSY
ncbi:hypothetical protein LZ554_007176 [Drepanopeziza brunnea f. sp. 'monogermtubi']|nr:hypothetical protein LZ554_007176 [Drepanopeziza brunnea f. sp. 'monogermtubi']